MMKLVRGTITNQRGQAVIMMAAAIFAVLIMAGLAIDLGRFFVVRAQLSKAVDGAALAGARVLPKGTRQATAAANETAQMNFSSHFLATKSHKFSIRFNAPAPMASRVAVSGTAELPMTFLRLVGLDHVDVPAYAEAERRPISVGLVLDNSYSMDPAFAGTNAIGYLRDAAANFVWFFDDGMDQMSLSLFSTGTELRAPLSYNFRSTVVSQIEAMQAVSNTNLSDGFKSAHQQLQTDMNPVSLQAIVFFTDGRPTALRGNWPVGGHTIDGVITGDQNPEGKVVNPLYKPNRLNERITGAYYTASKFPDGSPRTARRLRELANENLRQAAWFARNDGIVVYAIGLGNPNHPQVWKQPDASLLVQIANVPSGIDPRTGNTINNPDYDPNQPRGGFYFAPDATALEQVFEQVAREIILRLIQ